MPDSGSRLDFAFPPVVKVALDDPGATGVAIDYARLVPLRPFLLCNRLRRLGGVLNIGYLKARIGKLIQILNAYLVPDLEGANRASALRDGPNHTEALRHALVLRLFGKRGYIRIPDFRD